jgi:hypothetical protein
VSIDYSLYIGPYVVYKVGKKPAERCVSVCSLTSCNRRALPGERFCPEDGSEIVEVSSPTQVDTVDQDEMERRFGYSLIGMSGGQRIVQDGEHIYLSNQRCWRSDPITDHFLSEVVPVRISAAICLFEGDYFREIALLREHYGAENVRIAWGIGIFAS